MAGSVLNVVKQMHLGSVIVIVIKGLHGQQFQNGLIGEDRQMIKDQEGNKGRSWSQRKGWIGFVRSYRKFVEESSYDDIKWGKPEDSGAKSIEKKGIFTVYKF